MLPSSNPEAVTQEDGSIRVDGALSLDDDVPVEIALMVIDAAGSLARGQGQGSGPGWTGTVTPVGDPLHAGPGLGTGIVVARTDDPPGLQTFTWSEPVEIVA